MQTVHVTKNVMAYINMKSRSLNFLMFAWSRYTFTYWKCNNDKQKHGCISTLHISTSLRFKRIACCIPCLPSLKKSHHCKMPFSCSWHSILMCSRKTNKEEHGESLAGQGWMCRWVLETDFLWHVSGKPEAIPFDFISYECDWKALYVFLLFLNATITFKS